MDQARWIVVGSVVVCMVVVLTFLNRNFGQSASVRDVKNNIAKSFNTRPEKRAVQVDKFSGSGEKGGWQSLVSTRLKHRPPPEHTLAVENHDIVRDAEIKLEKEGRVIR